MTIDELKLKIEKMALIVETFNVEAQLLNIQGFRAFTELMQEYLGVCQQLLTQNVDFSNLPPKSMVAFQTPALNQISASINKIFPGHGLMLNLPPPALAQSVCPACKQRVQVTIQHPAYLVRCVTKVCPVKPANLVLPGLGMTIPLKVKG